LSSLDKLRHAASNFSRVWLYLAQLNACVVVRQEERRGQTRKRPDWHRLRHRSSMNNRRFWQALRPLPKAQVLAVAGLQKERSGPWTALEPAEESLMQTAPRMLWA
jgi:hypothetical protein